MKKILQINAVYEEGSTGRTTKELNEYLQARGFESRIAVSAGSQGENIFLIGNKFDHKLHAMFSRIFGLQGYFSYFATKKLLSYIDKEKPDVVHLRNLHGNFINLPLLFGYLSKKKIPTVITLHDCWFYTGKCCHYTVVKCDRWKSDCGNCPKLHDDNASLFFDHTRRQLNDKIKFIQSLPYVAVVGVSDWITNEAKKSRVFRSVTNISRIYNWLDLEQFHPVDSSDLKKELGLYDKFIILSVASGWSEKKGLDKIFDLAKGLAEDVVIVLIGHCSQNEKNFPKNILLAGTIRNPKLLSAYYSMADLYLNMSLEESFGKVSAEALACGTPVIAINSTANAEIIGPGCGFLFDKFDKKEVLLTIERVKKETKKKYESKCTQWARQNFSKEINAEEYIKIYEKAIGLKGI